MPRIVFNVARTSIRSRYVRVLHEHLVVRRRARHRLNTWRIASYAASASYLSIRPLVRSASLLINRNMPENQLRQLASTRPRSQTATRKRAVARNSGSKSLCRMYVSSIRGREFVFRPLSWFAHHFSRVNAQVRARINQETDARIPVGNEKATRRMA